MSSAISGYISQIQNAVYGEQVRSAIVSALEACYSDVENPDLQSAAFLEAINEAYESGILDITEVTQVSQMTNENIIYRYMGTQAGYTANTLYYYNGSAWVPIGSGVRTASTAAGMTDTSAIYKYTGSESGYVNGALYYNNGTAWVQLLAYEAESPARIPVKIFVPGSDNGYKGIYYNFISYFKTRCCTALTPIPVKKGDTVVLSDQSGNWQIYAKVYVNGVVPSNGNSGWISTSWTVPADGELVLAFRKSGETYDENLLKKANELVFIETATSAAQAYISSLNGPAQQENLINHSSMVYGYINSTTGGEIVDTSSTAGAYERATDFIPVKPGDVLTLLTRYTDFSKVSGDPYATWHFYDEDFAGTGNRYGGALGFFVDAAGNKYTAVPVVVPDDNTIEYMRASFRTYDCILPSLYSGVTLQPYIPSNPELEKVTKIQSEPSPVSLKFPIKAINHRGYVENGIPENSLYAFKNSKLHGFDMVETDIWQTSDDHFILWHNSTITINGVTQAPNLFTLEELRSVSIGTGDYVTQLPTLEEALALFKAIDIYPYLELKYVDESGAEAIVQLLEDYGITEKCTFISFNAEMLAFIAKYSPQTRLGFMGDISKVIMLRNGVNDVFLGSNGAPSARTLATAKANNVPIEVYTVNSASTMLGLDPYITGVTSDNTNFVKVLYDANITMP